MLDKMPPPPSPTLKPLAQCQPTLGIIGGLGPEPTASFYLQVVKGYRRIKNARSWPRIAIYSIPLPFDIERDALLDGNGAHRCVPFLLEAADSLQACGVTLLALPCNSLHAYIDALKSHSRLRIISMIDATVEFLKQSQVKEIALFGSHVTIRERLFIDPLERSGIKPVLPNDATQIRINELIYNIVTKGSSAKCSDELTQLSDQYLRNGVNVLLACTDLHSVYSQENDMVFDTISILAHATLKELVNDEPVFAP